MDQYNVPWKNKKDKVYFHGALTGEKYDENGNFINRLLLMSIANKNPELIQFGISDNAFGYD